MAQKVGSGEAGLDLYWIPLGADGTRVVRLSGRAYEAITAAFGRRPRCDLYHTALVARSTAGVAAIEVAPVPDDRGAADRGVIGEGPVGLRLLGRWRLFRYEVRCRPDGVIPDIGQAVGGAVRVTDDPDAVAVLLEVLPDVPTPVWGRDHLRAGEMWNSNSVVSWALTRAGLLEAAGGPPEGGRAPGWSAGIAVARRDPARGPGTRPAPTSG